jgi:hypothetical protein
MDHLSLNADTATELPQSPAAARNAEPILAQLRRYLPERGRVLEIASGTGEHGVAFAWALPTLTWQPSDIDTSALHAIRTRVQRAALANLAEPLEIDVAAPDWPVGAIDALVAINLIHIAPWAVTEQLLAGAGPRLPAGAPVALYGPFRHAGAHTSASNARFDASLRERDPRWGIRDMDAVAAAARAHSLDWDATEALPANNHLLVFHRRAD